MSRVLYVVGTGFTGSTLLSFLLNGHPRIASVGEATGPIDEWGDQRTYPCSCGKTLADCEFWRRVGVEMEARGLRFGPNCWNVHFRLSRHPVAHQLLTQSLRHNALDAWRDRLVLRVPTWRARLEETARRNVALVESILAVTEKSVFFDGTKHAVRARYLLSLTSLELFVVHLVRDSLGYVSSHMKRDRSLDSGIRFWKRTIGHANRLAGLLPADRFLRVRYEDLCRSTDAELARIARFAGLEPRPGPVNFRAQDHHMIGSQMRLGSSGEVTLDERWREHLTPGQARVIRWRTRRYRKLLGYD
jgi:hypothetical protein